MEGLDGGESRQQALKPIQTKTSSEIEGEDDAQKPKDTKDEEEEEPLSPGARIFHEPCFNVYVVAIVGCKTRIDVDVVKANLGHTLLKHPRFSSLQVKKDGGMKWVPTEVDLEKHVVVPTFKSVVDSPDKMVEGYISDLSKTTIDFSKPLWELHILNIKTSDAESLAVFRIHLSFGDGMSLMSLVLACTRQISDPEALPTLPVSKKSKPDLLTSGGVWWKIQLVWNTIVDVILFVATALFLRDTATPFSCGRNGGDGLGPRRFVHWTVSLDDIKLIKNGMKTTINDVVMGVSLAGLSRYLNRKYGEAKEYKGMTTQNKNNLPKNIRLRAALRINIRPSPGIHDLADLMEKDSKAAWGNWTGSVLLPFTIAMHDDPLDYVRQAKATIDRKKHSLEALLTFFIVRMVHKLFGAKAASYLHYRVTKHTTMCFSNTVGPVEEIGFYGHPMVFLAPIVYGEPHGLMIHFQSYINKMTVAVSVEEDGIPDPRQLCNDFEDSLNLIRDAVIARGPVMDN